MCAADAAEDRRGVMDRGDRTVRHILRVEHVRTRYERKTVDGRIRLTNRWIARVDNGQTIDAEHVAIRTGGQRSECRLPYAFGILRQLRRGHAAATDAGDVAGTSKVDVLCVWREDAEGDAAIRTDLG